MGAAHLASTKGIPSERREPASLMLNEQGMICDCDNIGEELFGYTLRELVSAHVSELLPQLSGVELFRDGQINQQLDYLCQCGHLFRVEGRHGIIFSSELSFVSLERAGARILRLFVLPSENMESLTLTGECVFSEFEACNAVA